MMIFLTGVFFGFLSGGAAGWGVYLLTENARAAVIIGFAVYCLFAGIGLIVSEAVKMLEK
jgi:hypothetical protein